MTEDGKPVVNPFLFVSQEGLPLDIVLMVLDKNGIVVGWIDFYESCIGSGWSHKTTMNKIETSVLDVYGRKYLETWQEKMRLYL